MNIAEAVLADRKRRRDSDRRGQLSRRKYGDLVGLPEQRIWAIEQNRKLKAGELVKLRPFIKDLFTEDDNGELPPAAAEGLDPEMERQGLLAAHAYLQQRLEGKPVPTQLAVPGRIETASLGEFPRIRAWIQSVHEWLDGVREISDSCDEPDCGGITREHGHEPEDDIYAGASLISETDYLDEQIGELRAEVRESLGLEPEVKSMPPVVSDAEDDALYAEFTQPASQIGGDVIAGEFVVPVEQEPLSDEFRYLTNSELRCFKRCRRRWWLDYHRRIRPQVRQLTGPASVGTRVHHVLAGYYVPQGAFRADPWDLFEETVTADKILLDEQEASEETRGRWSAEVDLARAMVEGYLEWVEETAADSGLEIVAPETRLIANPKFPGFPNVRLLAKLDVRAVRTSDNSRLFVDHKTVPDLTTPQKTLHLDEQMLHYQLVEFMDLVHRHDVEGTSPGPIDGVRTDGAIYNMLRKVKRTAAARPPFFGRVEVRHNTNELRSYWARVLQELTDIEAAREKLNGGVDHRQVMYPNPTRDCSWDCQHFAVCPMFDDGGYAEEFIKDNYVEANPLQRYEVER